MSWISKYLLVSPLGKKRPGRDGRAGGERGPGSGGRLRGGGDGRGRGAALQRRVPQENEFTGKVLVFFPASCVIV